MTSCPELVKIPQVHRPAQHAHVLFCVGSIQGSNRFVSEQRFVANAFALPHVVDGNAQVNSFVDQYELPAGEFIHKARTVQIFVSDFDIKIVDHPPPIRLGALRPEADFEPIVEAPLK